MICPWGDHMHQTDDPGGGPCSWCVEHIDQAREEFWADQAEAFPEYLR